MGQHRGVVRVLRILALVGLMAASAVAGAAINTSWLWWGPKVLNEADATRLVLAHIQGKELVVGNSTANPLLTRCFGQPGGTTMQDIQADYRGHSVWLVQTQWCAFMVSDRTGKVIGP